MKRFKSSLAVSAITAMSAMAFVFWGCTKEKEEEEKVTEKTINGIECVLVEAGTFWMGSQDAERKKPNDEIYHQVTISRDFWISKYPITNRQYGKTVGVGMEDNPVMGIYWEEAYAFARKKGGRLPTEAQWEYAARGGNKSKGYIYSGSNNLDEVAWHKGNSGGVAHKVGTKAPNELGIYDMTGNAYEWCADWYGDYGVDEETGTRTDPFINNPASKLRIFRGGYYGTDNTTLTGAGTPKKELRNAYREACYDISRPAPQTRHDASMAGIRIVFDK